MSLIDLYFEKDGDLNWDTILKNGYLCDSIYLIGEEFYNEETDCNPAVCIKDDLSAYLEFFTEDYEEIRKIVKIEFDYILIASKLNLKDEEEYDERDILKISIRAGKVEYVKKIHTEKIENLKRKKCFSNINKKIKKNQNKFYRYIVNPIKSTLIISLNVIKIIFNAFVYVIEAIQKYLT